MNESERAADLAMFVVHLGMSPRDYWDLTVEQREAILREANKRNRKR